MKKLFVLIAFMMIPIASIGHCADRWANIYSNEKFSAYLDAENAIRVDMKDDKKCMDFWLKYGDENTYLIDQTYIDLDSLKKRRLMYLVTKSVYYANNKFVDEKDKSNRGWQEAIPGTNYENVLVAVINWAEKRLDNIGTK